MANYISNRSELQWQTMYHRYIAKYYYAAGITRVGQYAYWARKGYVPKNEPTPLEYDEFKTKYILARNTNIAESGRAGDVYKTLIERDPTSPYQLSSKAARAYRAYQISKGEKPSNLLELRLTGGDTLSDYNKYLKDQFPYMTGKERSQEIGQVFFGSP